MIYNLSALGTFFKALGTVSSLVTGAGERAGAVAASTSLIEQTQPTRVEPLVAIDSTIKDAPWVSDILQTLTSVFSGYYLQAAAIHANVASVEVLKQLSKLNPERKQSVSMSGGYVSLESYTFKLPDYSADEQTQNTAGLEANNSYLRPGVPPAATTPPAAQTPGRRDDFATTGDQNVAETLRKAENLAVGKVLEVTFRYKTGDREASVVMPITVRLAPLIVQPTTFVDIYAEFGLKNKASERYHRWKAGELTFVNDLLFCNDLVDKHREALFRDKSGFYAEVNRRRRKNTTAALMSGTASLADASSMVILSKSTAVRLENELHAKLDSSRTRDQLFALGNLMLLVVVDPEWERVTIYHRGINLPTTLSIRDLKAANKSTGPDIAEILKAYQLGRTPSF